MKTCTFEFRVKLNQSRKKLAGRSKSGCLCCRKRKVKCDERKPACLSCLKRGFVCEWPKNGEQSLSRSTTFQPTRIVGYELGDFRKRSQGFRKFKFNIKSGTSSTTKRYGFQPSSPPVSPLSSQELVSLDTKPSFPLPLEETVDITSIEVDKSVADSWYRDYIRKLSLGSSPSHILTGHQTWLAGVHMTQEEAYCYDSYLKGFLVATSPQHAHVKLQPATIVVPYACESSVVRSLMYACGALFLSHGDRSMASVGIKMLEQCLNLTVAMLDMDWMDGSEESLMIVAMMLVVKDKYFATNHANNLVQIKIFYHLIKMWWFNRSKTQDDDQYFDYSSPSSLTTVLENKVRNSSNYSTLTEKVLELYKKLHKRGVPKVHLTSISDEPITTRYIDLSPSLSTLSDLDSPKRMLVDSFLYNYSVSWLTCDKTDLTLLESPFQVFEELKPMLQGDIYNCPAHWMNYPVTGAGLPAIELLAKTSWLALQVPLDNTKKPMAQKLLQFAKFYVSPLLPIDVFSCSKRVQNKLKESCYLGQLIAIASKIFLTKILDPEITVQDEKIQGYVDDFINGLKRLSPYCSGSSIAAWAFAVAGTALIENEHRAYLIERLDNFNKSLQMECITNIGNYLRTVWGDEGSPSLGLDGLFNRDLLQTLFI